MPRSGRGIETTPGVGSRGRSNFSEIARAIIFFSATTLPKLRSVDSRSSPSLALFLSFPQWSLLSF